jgi:hypothetical protein
MTVKNSKKPNKHKGFMASVDFRAISGRITVSQEAPMLTDTALKSLKPKDTPYKVVDRDGLYVTVSPAGTITFR